MVNDSTTQHLPDLKHAEPVWLLPAANDVKVEITITEVLCFPLQDRPIHRIYDSFDNLPEGPTAKAYAIKEIVVEKLLALSDRARNEPRDLYDLWCLFGSTDLRVAKSLTVISLLSPS